MLDIVLALDCRPNVIKFFKVDEAFQSMSLGKPVNESGSMLKNAADQVIRDPNVQNSVGAICHNVDVTAFCHAATVKDVDGRDIGERSDAVLRTALPGHDEHAWFHVVQS
jgi:hypothetical protein